MPWWRRRREPEELNVVEAYARWAPTYAPEAHNPLMALEQQSVLELLPAVEGRRALDLACGSGRYLPHLAAGRGSRVIGLDLSPVMLARAVAFSGKLVQADLRCLPFVAAAFDLVVCGLGVGHVPHLKPALAEIARVLAPGGVAVYSDFHPFAGLAGLKRTFRGADGGTYAAQHFVHLYADHHAACQEAGLVIDAVREPVVTFDHPWRGRPAVLVIRARKA